MTAAWFVYALVIGTVLAVGGYAAEALCRQLRLPARLAWMAALATLFVLIVLPVRPERAVQNFSALSARGGVPVTSAAADGFAIAAAASRVAAFARAATAQMIAAAVRWVPVWLVRDVALLLVLVACAALATLVFVHLRLRGARHGWPMTALHDVPVRVAPLVGPAVVGVLRPEIVVPRWLLRRSTEEQRLVVLHEREHLRAGDHLLLCAGSVAVALVPWHPAVWWMFARLRLAIELDCDARVLRRGVAPAQYGTLLIDLASQCTGFQVGATALADEGSNLERRLLAMNTTGMKRSLLRAGVLGAAAALALLAACEAKMPTASEIDAMDVASVEKSAQQTKVLDDKHLESMSFYVNGEKVSAQTAHGIAANQIATVNVEKRNGDSATIRIVTNGKAAQADKGDPRALSGLHAAMHGEAPAEEHMKFSTRPDSPAMAGLLFVNGKRVDAATFQRLDPRTIQTIDIVKGAEATKLYSDPAAANGVIKVTTN
jgi:beta-lactamase regulating signal transducer with metallopeptidase domain